MFCTNCGANISDDAKFCPNCGEDLTEVIDILKESPSASDISIAESDFKVSLEGDANVVYVITKVSNEFNITVHNTTPYSIQGVKVQLFGTDLVEVISGYNYYGTILSGQKVSAPVIILPKYLGSFTLTAELESNLGHSFAFPVEIRVKTAKDLKLLETPDKESKVPITTAEYSTIPTPRSKPPVAVNQALAVLIVIALVGIILMIWGITSFFRGGMPFNAGITVIVIGFILITIGTKGQCCILPFACACDDCDCDCD
ncbi:MAG: zinc ribbon domain-containing protein [Candidatus Hodarchaeota archaeon]